LEKLYNLYLDIGNRNFIMNYPSITHLSLIYVENAHAITFWSQILVILLGAQFNLFYTIPKIIGCKENNSLNFIRNWIILFYMIWLSYHSDTSIRYLSLIWIPLCVVTFIGLNQIIKKFKIHNKKMFYLFFISTNFLLYYPFIPFSLVNLDFHSRYYKYHIQIPHLLIYLLLFYIILLCIIQVSNTRSIIKISTLFGMIHSRFSFNKAGSLILCIIIGIAPIFGQVYVFISSDFDVYRSYDILVYDYREEVVDLAEFMHDQITIPEEIILVVNLPSLYYLSQRNVIDMLGSGQYLDEVITNLDSENISDVYYQFKSNNIWYIITILPANVFYPVFYTNYYLVYPFINGLNNSNANVIYTNTEFIVWLLI
ncbi:MAG: hypothetical protein OEZ01_07295, partial [Candidatus Heimdallarchaeota archaeon]|nr:hypothetical protein [Candidatus Heimdallarchaeota archaeon]